MCAGDTTVTLTHTRKTNPCSIDELLYNIGTFDHGYLPEDVAHHPGRNPVEQLYALVDTRRLVGWLRCMSVDTVLSKLYGDNKMHPTACTHLQVCPYST